MLIYFLGFTVTCILYIYMMVVKFGSTNTDYEGMFLSALLITFLSALWSVGNYFTNTN